jgi:hypothetical protein
MRYQEAEAALHKAIVLDPHAVAPHVDLGDLYLHGLRQPQAALDAYRTASALPIATLDFPS